MTGESLYFIPPDETAEIGYEVQVRPQPPADEAVADIYKNHQPDQGGTQVASEQLRRDGTGTLRLNLSNLTVQDSPLWVVFRFRKGELEQTPAPMAFSLAEPVPAEVEAPADLPAGQAATLRVRAWGANAYDEAGRPPTLFRGLAENRVPQAAKDAVKWRRGEEDAGTGATLDLTPTEEQQGTTLAIEAYVGDAPPGHARVEIAVPRIRLQEPSRANQDPRTDVPLHGRLTLEAVCEPAIEGTWTWRSTSDKVRVTPDPQNPARATVEGLNPSASQGDVPLEAKLCSTATRHEYTATLDLTVREFRVELRLADLNLLCDDVGTAAGRQQRLQIAGLFYEPLSSSALARRFAHNWTHFKKLVPGDNPSDDDAANHLVQLVNREVIRKEGAGADARSELPKAGEKAKIRLPGGFAFDGSNDGALGFPSHHRHRFLAEQAFYGANDRVGAIPLIAKVERKGDGGEWESAGDGHAVHFQLVTPDAIAAGSGGVAPPTARTATNVRGGRGPGAFVDEARAAFPNGANDAQVDNCPVERGGKRRVPGSGADYFETSARAGLVGENGGPVPGASTHALAVSQLTNGSGEAVVVFRPSRQGGDRYKLRVFLDPVGPGGVTSDGTEDTAVKAETGTLVVWRTVRLSRYIHFDYPSSVSAADRTAATGAISPIDFTSTTIVEGFGRAWMELIVEPTAAIERRHIGDSLWRSAMAYARQYMGRPRGVSQDYDLAALFPNANSTVGLLNMNDVPVYDGARNSGTFGAGISTEWTKLEEACQAWFMQYFTRKALSGLVVIQAPQGDTLNKSDGSVVRETFNSSGIAVDRRGCYVFYGDDKYNDRSFGIDRESNTLHEMGHNLFLPHQWTDRDASGAVSGGVPPEHDYTDYCVMSYQNGVRNEFDYCGKCLLKLMGWDTSQLPLNNT